MSYRDQTIKLLWGKSAGRCAYPGCRDPLITEPKDEVIGQIAHIVAQSAEGPRGNPALCERELNAYSNLILLCRKHHAEIDTPGTAWTVDRLQQIKSDHESQVAELLQRGAKWRSNIADFYYLNLPRLMGMASLADCGVPMFLEDIGDAKSFLTSGFGGTVLLRQAMGLLERLDVHARQVGSERLTASDVGLTISFDGRFTTKGVPGIDTFESGKFRLKGDPAKDPHVRCTLLGGQILRLSLDPRWITSSTSFANLRSASIQIAGLCIVKRVDDNMHVIDASPIVLGIPQRLAFI